MENIAVPQRTVATLDGEARCNARGDLLVSPGLGIVREFAISDTAGLAAAFALYGLANAIEVAAGSGTLTLTDAGGQTTLGAVSALPAGWSSDGLAVKSIDGASGVTAVRVRW